jgi:uncharacterized damage-inducible protein DinB
MRRGVLSLLLLAVLLGSTGSAGAQESVSQAGGSDEVLALWDRISQMLTAMAEQFPEEKYGYKPTPEVRSFREQLMHVAGANYFFIRTAGGEKKGPEHAGRENKADVVAVLEESFADGAALIRSTGDAGMNKPIQHPFRDHKVPLHTIWIMAVGHATEHYGQLVVYYRLNGLVPPATAADQARRQQQEQHQSQPQ